MNKLRNFNRYSLIFTIAILLAGTSCKSPKNPSLSESTLISEIQMQEGQRADNEKEAQMMRDSLDRLPRGFRYKEIRSVDPGRPPVLLHFTDSLPQKEFKLSEIASQLEYVVVKTSRDSTFYLPHASFIMSGEYIVCYGIQGIELFDRHGNYIRSILKNQGLMFRNGYPGGYSLKELMGLPFMKISAIDNTLLYCYLNGPANKVSIMKVDPGGVQTEKIQTGETQQSSVQGTEIQQFEGEASALKLGFYPLENGLWASLENKWTSGSTGDLLTIYGSTGDTLCQFRDYDRIHNYPGGPYRNTDREFSYHYNRTLSIKPAHNDTLFRVIPPNRLLPVYVFDFGQRKVGLMEGLISSNDLSEKNLSIELFETNRYLFFLYTRNHNIARNIKSGSCKYFFTLIDKKSNQIYHLSSIKTSDGGMVNDLDGGVPFWPDGVNEEGIPFMWCSGREFKKQSVSKRISGLADNDAVIILAK